MAADYDLPPVSVSLGYKQMTEVFERMIGQLERMHRGVLHGIMHLKVLLYSELNPRDTLFSEMLPFCRAMLPHFDSEDMVVKWFSTLPVNMGRAGFEM